MNVSILGGGSWGLALARVLSDNNHNVLVYDINEDIVKRVNEKHVCIQLNEIIPSDIFATSSVKEVVNHSDILVFAVPTKVLRVIIKDVINELNEPKVFVNCGKGIEPETFLRVSEIFTELIDKKYFKGFVSLTGPSHSEEVIVGNTTAVVAASENEEMSKKIQLLFNNNNYFRVYTSNDLIGCELGGALKNIFALASGVLSGLGIGDNGRAGLITRGLVEMKKFYQFYGAKEETLYGLTGIGDLIVTATSKHSRNFQAGYKIGNGKDLEETLNSMTMVVEGIRTCEAAYKLANENNLDTPIINGIHDIVFKKVAPKEIIQNLLSRNIKSE